MNYHFHDERSSDAAGTLLEHCAAARAAELTEICVTNHVETMTADGGWQVDPEEVEARFEAVRQSVAAAAERFPDLGVRFGAELEYRPEWRTRLEKMAASLPFDLLIGSVHVVEGHNISGGPGVHDYFADRARTRSYGRYFEMVVEMVEWGGFDVVGHFDIVKRYGHLHYGPYSPVEFEAPIREALGAMARRGLGLEINTSGVGQAPADVYPHGNILEWALQEGVPHLTLGTDAHSPDGFGQGIREGLAAARRAGWKELAVFEGRRVAGRIPLEAPSSGGADEVEENAP